MKNKRLLVEGNNDRHVILALCKEFDIPGTFDIVDCNGISNLKEQIPVWFIGDASKTLGIIIDADVNLQSQWDSLKSKLSAIGFTVPDVLPETGLIVENGTQKAGVWIMPNNNANGMLEDFISFLVPSDDPLLPVVHSTLETIESRNLNKYSPIHKSKAIIHTWLAWQEDPGTPMGLSITKKYLSTDEATCKKFIHWLTKLFMDSNTASQ